MSTCVYGIAKADAKAVRVATRLKASGFTPTDISVLAPDRGSLRDLAIDNSTKAPEGAATGVSAGAVLVGALGCFAVIGSLAIPGLGPLLAAGPIMAALSGAAVGGAVG